MAQWKECCAAQAWKLSLILKQETWICAPSHVTKDDGKYLLDHELAGTL